MIHQWITRLKHQGIELHVNEGHLFFKAKEGVMTPKIMTTLKDRKNEIIHALEDAYRIAALAKQSRRLVPAPDQTRLSPAQERLWFLEKLEPGAAVYHLSEGIRFRYFVHPGWIEKSIRMVMRRHRILRTGFIEIDGKPRLTTLDSPEWRLTRLNLDLLADHDAERLQRDLARRFVVQPFSLDKPPLLRAILFERSASGSVLLVNMHHLVSDQWSMSIFKTEWRRIYDALLSRKEPGLAELRVQYADFAYWRHKSLTDAALQNQIRYWKQKLSDLPFLEFPTDRPRPPKQTFHGRVSRFAVAPERVKRLHALAHREGTTLFMVLLAALKTLVHRYTNQSDFALGVSSGARRQTELDDLIGLFVNLLAMRADCSGDPTFRGLLARTRATALDAYQNQSAPFEKVVEICHPQRDLSRPPIFQIQIMFDEAPRPEPPPPALASRLFEWGDGVVARMDLTLGLTESSEGLHGGIEYNVGLFDRETVDRIAAHYLRILHQIGERPETRISEIALLGKAERAKLLEWNRTESPFPAHKSIPELFRECAASRPNEAAVRRHNRQWTYAQIDRLSDQIAVSLRTRGLVGETPVGIFLEQDWRLIAAILGVAKAGGAYVPLESHGPPKRLGLIMRDCAMGFLVTRDSLLDRLPAHEVNFINVLCLDALSDRGDRACAKFDIAADQLFYIMYTSGSMGQPKGVCITHRNVVRLVYDVAYLKVRPGARVAQTANLTFDAYTFEIWTTLLSGACLCLFDKKDLLDPDLLAAAIERYGIQVMFLTTPLFNLMARERPGLFNELEYLIFGGDQVDPVAVSSVIGAGGPASLINGYGPTECTTFSTWHSPQRERAHQTVPIGAPMANTRVHVLDRYLNEAPVGVQGEIYISGEGLARAYLNRPDRTAEKFIPNPFNRPKRTEAGMDRAVRDGCPRGDSRLYRTGDLGRRIATGDLIFLGRADTQVKIRGFRVEPEEIASVLGKRPGILGAVVIPHTNPSGRSFLTAYVRIKDKASRPNEKELANYLKQRLPRYMIPAFFVCVDRFPLLANGKLNRAGLPRPRFAPERKKAPPRTDSERAMAEIWKSVLGVETVGVHDDFFEIGGDSLVSTQILARARELGFSFNLNQFMENPTIARLLEAIAENGEPTQ